MSGDLQITMRKEKKMTDLSWITATCWGSPALLVSAATKRWCKYNSYLAHMPDNEDDVDPEEIGRQLCMPL